MQEGGSLNEGGARKKERRGGRSNEGEGVMRRKEQREERTKKESDLPISYRGSLWGYSRNIRSSNKFTLILGMGNRHRWQLCKHFSVFSSVSNC